MNTTKFNSIIWLVCIMGLPVSVYLGATLANITGLPYDTGCKPYDASTGAFTSILISIPLAIIITVLSAIPILRMNTALKIWAMLIGISLVSISLFIIYQSDWCK